MWTHHKNRWKNERTWRMEGHAERHKNGWMDVWKDKRMETWMIYKRLNRWTNSEISWWMEQIRWTTDKGMHESIDGWMDRQMNWPLPCPVQSPSRFVPAGTGDVHPVGSNEADSVRPTRTEGYSNHSDRVAGQSRPWETPTELPEDPPTGQSTPAGRTDRPVLETE